MSTNVVSSKDIKRKWHLIDVNGKVLGRVATEIATKLMGKHKPNYVPYLDMGDYVVVTNAAKVRVTGEKLLDKIYFRHSGYPGGDKSETLAQLLSRRPEKVIEEAVKGMLPKSRLGRKLLKKLFIYPDEHHPHQDKFAKQEGQNEQ